MSDFPLTWLLLSVRLANFSLNAKFLRLAEFKKYVGDDKSAGLAGIGGLLHREIEGRAEMMCQFLF